MLTAMFSFFTDHSLSGNSKEVYTLEATASSNNNRIMKTNTTSESLPVPFYINDNQDTRNILYSNSSGSSSCLQSQLWLPLAVPPYFLVNAHHTALTLPSLSQCTLTIIHWKSHFFGYNLIEYTLFHPPNDHWAPFDTTQGRISYLFETGYAYTSNTKVPTSTDSVFFPAIPAKKDTSMFVKCVGVIKID